MSEIYYFGFGGIVSPGLRELRGIETTMTAPAVLNDYRLTFAVAGAANIIEKRGWEVHGVLMELSPKDWDILKSYEAGWEYTLVDVWTYGEDTRCYQARVFIMESDNLRNEELPSDRLPQERFLRVIASGMRHHGVDEDYIENEVMNCPYIPKRKPEEYLKFPSIDDDMESFSYAKTIPISKYLKQATKRNWFAIGDRVFSIPGQSLKDDHPFVKWLRMSYIGHLDVTWTVSRTLYDPDLPKCASIDELTDVHHAWCENMMVDYFAQADVTGVKMIGHLIQEDDASKLNGKHNIPGKVQKKILTSCSSLMKKVKQRNSISGSREFSLGGSFFKSLSERQQHETPVKLFSDRSQATREFASTLECDRTGSSDRL